MKTPQPIIIPTGLRIVDAEATERLDRKVPMYPTTRPVLGAIPAERLDGKDVGISDPEFDKEFELVKHMHNCECEACYETLPVFLRPQAE